MRADNQDPWWLIEGLDIVGFEEEDSEEEDEGETEEEDDEEDSENEDDESDDNDEDEESEDDDEKSKSKGTAGLKSALRKERMARKKAERELRKLKAKQSQSDDDEKSEEDKDKSKSTPDPAAEERATKLARKLRDQAIDNALLKFTEKFQDPEDVLRLVDRKEIDVDQDEDDPSEIEVDLESVEDAVKALAQKKPHLLKGREGRVQSGSKFGGKKKSKQGLSEEELRKKYPALRR